MEKQKIAEGIMKCKKELSRYGIELENGMRTLRITDRCVLQTGDMEANDPLEHFLFAGRSRRHDGRWDEGFGLLRILRRYGCLTDMDYVLNPKYWDEAYTSFSEELVYDETDNIAVDADMEMEAPEYFPELESQQTNPVMGISFGFAAVEEVVVDKDNPYFSSRDGVLFDKSMTRLIWYPYGKRDVIYNVPDSVREIGPWAFAGEPYGFPVRRKDGSIVQDRGRNKRYVKYVFNRSLRQVILPDTVALIRDNAFNHCLFLTSVRLSANLREILWDAFCGCKELQEIQLPDSLEYIEPAFGGCCHLKKVRFLGTRHQIARTWETYSCSWFSVYYGPVPYSPDYMRQLFGGCSENGDRPMISFDTRWFTILDGVMFNQDRTELIWCDRSKSGTYTVPATVTCIGEMAFMNCKELTQIDISHPDTVIEKRAFFRCEKLERVVFQGAGSVKHIGESAFHCCQQLQKIPLTGAESIGDFAFFACRCLRVVRVPESCGHIGERAFDACDVLDSLIVPQALAGFKYHRLSRNKKAYRDFEASCY